MAQLAQDTTRLGSGLCCHETGVENCRRKISKPESGSLCREAVLGVPLEVPVSPSTGGAPGARRAQLAAQLGVLLSLLLRDPRLPRGKAGRQKGSSVL